MSYSRYGGGTGRNLCEIKGLHHLRLIMEVFENAEKKGRGTG